MLYWLDFQECLSEPKTGFTVISSKTRKWTHGKGPTQHIHHTEISEPQSPKQNPENPEISNVILGRERNLYDNC